DFLESRFNDDHRENSSKHSVIITEAYNSWLDAINVNRGVSNTLAHFPEILHQPARIAGLESRAGLPNGSLTKAASNESADVATAINNMQAIVDDLITSGAKKVDGSKVHYWKESSVRPKEGIRVIEYEGKIQSVNPTSKRDWDNFIP
ncbi:MAG: hypothetical protein NTX25_23900, partial [Proteobacteria bacterium]|nr:hypothetical protein [Pseudomonadota bacterium]